MIVPAAEKEGPAKIKCLHIFVFAQVLSQWQCRLEGVTQWALQEFKADLFGALANPVRIRILEAIRSADELSVSEIQEAVGIGSANASQHLAILRARGVVRAARSGQTMRYSVVDSRVFELLDIARGIFEQRLASQQDALRAEDEAAPASR